MEKFSHRAQIYHSLDNVIIFFPHQKYLIGTSNAVGDYTPPNSFCTTRVIRHELDALINQRQCEKTVYPRRRGPADGWNPIHRDASQTSSVFFLFANVPEIWKYNNNEILVSAKHLRTGAQEAHRRECPGWPCLPRCGRVGWKKACLFKWECPSCLFTHWDKCVSTRPPAWAFTKHHPISLFLF